MFQDIPAANVRHNGVARVPSRAPWPPAWLTPASAPAQAERLPTGPALGVAAPAAGFVAETDPDWRRGLIHQDHADHAEWEEIDWPEPCGKCNKYNLWMTLAGNWRCRRCDPPTIAERVRKEAARLRQLNRPRAAKKAEQPYLTIS
jgi:hypothetical protein